MGTECATRLTMDAAVMAAVGAVVVYFSYFAVPHRKGFFCNDFDLSHPYMESSIHSWTLYLVATLVPFFAIALIEWFRVPKRYRDVKGLIGRLYVYFVVWFGFGALVTAAVTQTLKVTVGRLRPYFFNLCQPDFAALEPLCSRGVYVVDYNCTGSELTPHRLWEMHASFPSAHASYGFHASVFLALYLHRRWTSRKWSVILRPFFQLLAVVAAAMVAVSRVNNLKHFPSDVTAGAVLGAGVAVFAYLALGSAPLYRIYSRTGEDDDDEDEEYYCASRDDSVGSVSDGETGGRGSRASRCREVTSSDFARSYSSGKGAYNTFSSARLVS